MKARGICMELNIYILKIISGSEWSRSNVSLDLCDTLKSRHSCELKPAWSKLLCGKSTITDVQILIANTLLQFNKSALIVYSSASYDVLSKRKPQIKKYHWIKLGYECWRMSKNVSYWNFSGFTWFTQSIFVRTISEIFANFHRRTSYFNELCWIFTGD